VPVAKPVIASEQPPDEDAAPQQVVLDAKPLAAGTEYVFGLPDAGPGLSLSRGPGSGGGVGGGTGTGLGSGTGPGVGPGSGGGFGGGAYRVGHGVIAPTLLQKVNPKYTPDALRQRIQGTVGLEVVVGSDGVPAAVRVTRSLDPHGLDEEAITAVREWRFAPGRIGDRPVDVLVNILLDFRIS
jgi:TonB family protein